MAVSRRLPTLLAKADWSSKWLTKPKFRAALLPPKPQQRLLMRPMVVVGAVVAVVVTIVAVVAYEHWGLSGVLVALGVELVVIYVVAEAAPKTWALERTDVAAVRVAAAASAVAAVAAAVPWAARAAAREPFRLRYVLASALYGEMPLDVILPEVAKTGSESIDISRSPRS